jgi:hypothetical protein
MATYFAALQWDLGLAGYMWTRLGYLARITACLFCTHSWFKITSKILLVTSLKAMFHYLIEFEIQNSNHQSRTMFRTHETQDNVIPDAFFF